MPYMQPLLQAKVWSSYHNNMKLMPWAPNFSSFYICMATTSKISVCITHVTKRNICPDKSNLKHQAESFVEETFWL